MAIEKMHPCRAQAIQRQNRAPRRTAGAQKHDASGPSSRPNALAHGLRQADRVGVAGLDAAVSLKDQKIGGAGGLRGGVAIMRQGEGRFLVRHRDIDAAKSRPLQADDQFGRNLPAAPPAAPARRRSSTSSSQ